MNPNHPCPVGVFLQTYFDYAGNGTPDTIAIVLEDGSRQRLTAHQARGIGIALMSAADVLEGKSCD